jgi:hypothetical protein
MCKVIRLGLMGALIRTAMWVEIRSVVLIRSACLTSRTLQTGRRSRNQLLMVSLVLETQHPSVSRASFEILPG